MANSKYYNTGGGQLFFTPIVGGVLGTEADFGQTENVNFSTEIETLTHDNTEGTVSVEDMSILKKITGTLTIDTIEVSPEMLMKAFLATDKSTVVATATATALADVTVTLLDTAYPIGLKHVSNVVVQDATDTTTYVLGTDYTLDATTGMITALSTGAITALDVLHIVADNAGYRDIQLEGFMESKLEGKLRFVGASATGINYTYTFHRVSLLASGDYGLKSTDEFAKLSFEGSMLSSENIVASDESALFLITGTELT
jgi:hypothetical protein